MESFKEQSDTICSLFQRSLELLHGEGFRETISGIREKSQNAIKIIQAEHDYVLEVDMRRITPL